MLRPELVMQFIRRHWYNLGIAFAAIAVAWASFGHLTTVQVILLLNFAVLPLHQFEEYGWLGGFPWINNEVFDPRGGPDVYEQSIVLMERTLSASLGRFA